ncbi:transcription-repair coupling factor [Thermohalobacter berrensis]|uniref:Transcription-repair-coupling factor n=2 Tax=Thermohalobacter berrensis TaxID=99594 RepID=A0A419T8Z4_9FIRM|nr:transcription-repair coupling factor [Thermohalobacter berrensis]
MFIDQLRNLNSYKEFLNLIDKKVTPISIHGLSEENIAHIGYGLNQHLKKQILILVDNEIKAKKMVEDLKLFTMKNVELFPHRDVLFYDIDAHSHENSHQRLKVIDRLINKEKIIVIASIEAMFNKVMRPEFFNQNSITLEFGKQIDLQKLSTIFNLFGYERVDMVEGKGQYSIRGGIIDFFPIISDNPFRVELFDDEIDSIRSFDIKTQRSIDNIQEVTVFPAREILITDKSKKEMISNIKKDMKGLIKKLEKGKETILIDKLREKFNHYIEYLENGFNIENINVLTPYISEDFTSIISYLNNDSVILINDPQRIKDSIKAMEEDFRNKFSDFFERGEALPKQKEVYLPLSKVKEQLESNNIVSVFNILKKDPLFTPKEILKITSKNMHSFHNKVDIISDELKELKYKGYKVIILSGVEDRGKRLVKTLKEKGVECNFVENHNHDIKSGQVFVTTGSISQGFEYPEIKFALISDKEIFGKPKKRIRKKKKKRKNATKITSYADLKPGDYVVHETHGIGKYEGIIKLKVQGVKKDYLTIKYSGKDKLYIPVDQMDLIQKYIGGDALKPKINKLGSNEWTKTKAKAKKAIEDMAKELLELYAKRQTAKGFAFSKDKLWQRQFEDLFPYEETEDQLRCIKEIKEDMEKSKPMDRLLCGDVGYGKTEVALRAAFKAVMDSKQVAFLVPTTILAQQHYNTLKERFEQFPINIEMLSRFRTPTQQKNILNQLKSGNIDIIVGTHRLLSKDVKFYDLGLLVVDEEQRFGVKHKESLKKLKESIDVLTLTATPIPRTLHMSLIGIRDMSVIEEPPEDRYPVQTYVVEFNEQLVRDSIIKELNRGGQVYFVYNRVKGIRQIASRLKKLVPEARIAVAHGQMSERELEGIMIDFLNHEYDILVCTTIIETGMDISNVNTLLVYDADKMGLSQLYQLRGRVGRSNRIAFSYFMYEKDKVLSEVAEKRLKAIKEFTEFGSGFKIAMRDLEIRGAGNILGPEQHGHMAAIGYDLYVKFLDATIKRLKGEEKEEDIETTIELNVDGHIPTSYIPSEEQKVEVYKRISAIENKEDYSDVLEELIDRFGDIRSEVNNLLRISYIKSVCKKAKITSLTQKDKTIKIEFYKPDVITPELIGELSKTFGRRMGFDVSKNPCINYRVDSKKQDKMLAEIEEVVEKIYSFIKR